jgi:hypothetical protein
MPEAVDGDHLGSGPPEVGSSSAVADRFDWTIRSMLTRHGRAATAAAKRRGLTNAAYIGELIDEDLARERSPLAQDVIAPGEQPPPGGFPAGLSVDDIDRVIAMAERIARLRGVEMPKRSVLLARAHRLLLLHLDAEIDRLAPRPAPPLAIRGPIKRRPQRA